MIDIQAGDVVVCVDDGPSPDAIKTPPFIKAGRIYRVTYVDVFEGTNEVALLLEGDPADLMPEFDESAWEARRFRKVQKADEGFTTWMKALRPTKQKADA